MTNAGGDEVDQIITEWAGQRPDLDTAPFAVFSRITRLARRMDRVRRQTFAALDLEPWGFDVLSTLRRSGAPYALTPGQLMNRLLISSGTMTNRIDRLEQAGLVTRSRTDADRRAILVTLTDAGRQRCEQATELLLDRERTLLSDIAPAHRAQLAASLRELLLAFEADPTT